VKAALLKLLTHTASAENVLCLMFRARTANIDRADTIFQETVLIRKMALRLDFVIISATNLLDWGK
jgi:hypothetical protein